MLASDSRRSLLLLGGATHQVPAIECARRLGYRTVLCDYLPDNPGQYVADVFYQESTTDRDRMLEVARAEGVSGALSFGTDVAAPTAAYVGEKLGLPTNPLTAVETLSEKHLFRRHLAENGFPCPGVREVRVGETTERVLENARGLRWPLMLKPTDSSGSKGVTLLEGPDAAVVEAALASAAEYSRNGILVLEEFIRQGFPRVIGGDVFVVDGEVRFWGLMSCQRDTSLGGLVPVGERWPSGMTPSQERAVREQVQALVTSLGLRFGEMNVEVILDEHDVPHFLELAARAGGNMIPTQLSDVSGIDLIEANVRFAMGDASMDVRFDGTHPARRGCVATYVLHSGTSGIFRGIDVADELVPHVYRTVMYHEPGERVGSLENASGALGILFLSFDDEAQMDRLLERTGELVSVRVDEY